jgi:transmembrane sensor
MASSNNILSRIRALAQKKLEGRTTPSEDHELAEWLDHHDQGELQVNDTREELEKRMLRGISERTTPVVPMWRKVVRIASVAAVILLLAGSIYWLLKPAEKRSPVAVKPSVKNDVAPGTIGAVLAFDNGATIILDTAKNGRLMQGVTKSDAMVAVQGVSVQYATLTTPRAKKQELILDDGTKVWLNAASSIRFPSVFTGTTRNVEVTGEVYFEVAKDAAKPFIVKVNDAFIEVLGTHFNVMAYNNEGSLQTTLLEGSVRFRKGDKSILLKPGQQSRLLSNGEISLVKNADTELATAWKNGYQSFRDADLATIMRQVERWYDVDVEYQTRVPPGLIFTGEGISRNVNLSELLKAFGNDQVRFEIDGITKKVIIKKQEIRP